MTFMAKAHNVDVDEYLEIWPSDGNGVPLLSPACEAVLKQLMALGDDAIRLVLVVLHAQRPDLWSSARARAPSPKQLPSQLTLNSQDDQVEELHPPTMMSSSSSVSGDQELPIVQFSTAMYFVQETEGKITLDVMRIGDLSKTSLVPFTTKDVTAKAGDQYVHTERVLTFEPGSNEASIDVPIKDSPHWNTTAEFLVELEPAPDGSAQLGKYLYKARVKVIDMDTFPSNKFCKQIGDDDLATVPKWALMIEYFKLNFKDPVIRRGTIKALLVDSVANLYFLLGLFTDVVLINAISRSSEAAINVADEKGALTLMCIIAFLNLAPFGALHLLGFRRTTWKIAGASRSMLQKALVRKFLNYDEEARLQLDQGDIVMGITRDVVNVVHNGYINCLRLLKNLGQMLMVIIFLVTAAFISKT